ncbi:MAG: TetR/AcrR family transcriptional regulator [Halieaceae bacterium]|jgi:AcrR family transcriptional regulator|nr:TetR/AcrR family transcriptional regulator [Halieaceae bacterium]
MTTAAPPRSTAERILDAAEDLFAERGYSATSLGDVADRVGIRSPSLYNHFRNKEALYLAVVERLLQAFLAPLEALRNKALTREHVLEWLEITVRMHHKRPNLARLVQHAALSGGPYSKELATGLFRPMLESQDTPAPEVGRLDKDLQPWAVIALNNMVMSYITMAPMYESLLGEDPLGTEAQDKQLQLIMTLADLVLDEGTLASPAA